jgi:hypothetical protein
MRHVLRAGLAMLLSVAAASVAQGQCTVAITSPPSGSCTQNTNMSFTVAAVARLTVGPFVGVGNPTFADYDAGYRDAVGPVLTVRANVPWTVSIRGTSPTWGATNDPTSGDAARANKPVGDLQWSLTGSPTSYVPLTSTLGGATLSSAGATNETVIATYLRTLWDYSDDTPGTYTLTVTFTIVAN